MDLIFDHVVEFDHVHDTDSDSRVKSLTGLSIVENSLTIGVDVRFVHELSDLFVGSTVEDRGGDFDA